MSNEEKTIEQTTDQSEVQAETVGQDLSAEAQEAQADGQEAQTQETQAEAQEAQEQAQETAERNAAADKPAQKPAKAKPQKTGGLRCDLGKNKTFKWIYYPLLAVVAVIMAVFSVIDGFYGYSPNVNNADYYKAVDAHVASLTEATRSSMAQSSGLTGARTYITDALIGGGFTLKAQTRTDDDKDAVDADEKVVTTTEWAMSGGAKVPTVTEQTSTLTAELQEQMGLDAYLVGANITNIIAAIPSKAENAGAVIVTVRYDSRPDCAEAGSAAFVANALQTAIGYAKSNAEFKNDVIVVFTEDLDCGYGSYAFFDAFTGLDNAVSRGKYGVNLDAYGNGGTLAITDASNADYSYISAVASVTGGAFNSSAVPDSMESSLVNANAVKAFGDIPAVRIAVLGGLNDATSDYDGAKELSQAIVHQQAQVIKSYIDRFGDCTQNYTAKGDSGNVFFSYLSGGTVTYTAVASYVIGALLILVIAGAITAIAIKKTFSVKKLLLALGMQLLVAASTLAAMFAAYFLVTLMLTGFGVLPIHAVTSLRYLNAGILIAAMIVTVAATFGFTTVYKKLFKVTSSDAVRGNALSIALAGVIMSFACPAYSFLTVWLGMLGMIVMLVTALCQQPFKSAFGIGLDKLYLYAIPAILAMPIVLANIAMLGQILPLVLLPVLMLLFTSLIGCAVPYLDRTQKLLDAVAKKLPMRTVRVEHTVTERVEERAKKGRYTERTYKRIDKEKVPVNYKNYFGISVLTVIGIVVALFSGGFGVDFGKALTDHHAYTDAVYNDAIVYEWTKDASGTVTQKAVVDDLTAYKYIRYAVTDLEWDGTRYAKTVNYSSIIANAPSIVKSDNGYEVSTFDGAQSHVTITIPAANAITKITVKEQSKAESGYDGYVYEFENRDTIVLRMPYGFGNFVMEIEGASPTNILYEEQSAISSNGSDTRLDNMDEWNRVRGEYADTDIVNMLCGGIVIKCEFSL